MKSLQRSSVFAVHSPSVQAEGAVGRKSWEAWTKNGCLLLHKLGGQGWGGVGAILARQDLQTAKLEVRCAALIPSPGPWCGSVSTYLPWTNKSWAGSTTKTCSYGQGLLSTSSRLRSPGVALFRFFSSHEGEVKGFSNTQLWDLAGWPCYSHQYPEAL